MRFIDRTGCEKMSDKGISRDVKEMKGLTRTAIKIAEENGLGVLKRRDGVYRVIKASGLGANEEFFKTLEDVDKFFKAM